MTHLKICFIAQNALAALSGDAGGHAGGIERQQALMANWFAKQGHDVSVVIWGAEDIQKIYAGPVQVIELCRRDAGIPGLRFFWPRWTSLIGALNEADADLYYYNCGDGTLGQIAMWSGRNGRKLIYSVASDVDCEPDFRNLSRGHDRSLYQYGLLRSDNIIVQSDKQAQMLEKNFGLSSTKLPMPSVGSALSDETDVERSTILWVGRISPEKRPEWFLDIAEAMPDQTFDLVGAPNNQSEYSQSILSKAERLRNVRVLGRVPYSEMSSVYASARILCSTSKYEGFPNVFLEAWGSGIPVVATCDPDNLISAVGLGGTGSSVTELLAEIGRLMKDQTEYDQVAAQCLSYFQDNHEVDSAMKGFLDYFSAI